MNSGTLGSRTALPVSSLSQPTLVVLYSFSHSPLLWLISEWTEDLLPSAFPRGSSSSRGPGPCRSLLAHLGLSPDLVFVLGPWGLFAFPAANGQFSVNHNCFTPLGRTINGRWACWLSSQRSWQLSWALPSPHPWLQLPPPLQPGSSHSRDMEGMLPVFSPWGPAMNSMRCYWALIARGQLPSLLALMYIHWILPVCLALC